MLRLHDLRAGKAANEKAISDFEQSALLHRGSSEEGQEEVPTNLQRVGDAGGAARRHC
jgi:hypothetical protein